MFAVAAVAGGSIFSANGVGEELADGGIRAQGLAGGGYGWSDSAGFNTANPALAAFLTRSSLRVGGQIGFWTTMADGRTDADAEFIWKDFALYFPVSQRWVIGLGASPRRQMDIKTFTPRRAVFTNKDSDTVSTVDYEERNVWRGSTVDLRLDNAFRIHDRLAIGLSLQYVVLRNERRRTLDFPTVVSNDYYFDAAYRESEVFRGWSPVLGIYYSPMDRLGLGLAFRPRSRGDWSYEFQKFGSSVPAKAARSGDDPGNLRAGFSYRLHSRLMAVGDLRTGFWTRDNFGPLSEANGTPENPLFLSLGFERLPGRAPRYVGFQTWALRGGAYYRKHYWPLQAGQAVEDLGITGGLSAPLANARGYLHWSLEAGLRGMDESALGASETFVRTALQIELGEKWFERSRSRIPR